MTYKITDKEEETVTHIKYLPIQFRLPIKHEIMAGIWTWEKETMCMSELKSITNYKIKNFFVFFKNLIKKAWVYCQLCQNQRAIVVHHLNRNRKDNTEENMVMLCKECHFGIHHHRKFKLKTFKN